MADVTVMTVGLAVPPEGGEVAVKVDIADTSGNTARIDIAMDFSLAPTDFDEQLGAAALAHMVATFGIDPASTVEVIGGRT
jgi:hypothetical protein